MCNSSYYNWDFLMGNDQWKLIFWVLASNASIWMVQTLLEEKCYCIWFLNQ